MKRSLVIVALASLVVASHVAAFAGGYFVGFHDAFSQSRIEHGEKAERQNCGPKKPGHDVLQGHAHATVVPAQTLISRPVSRVLR